MKKFGKLADGSYICQLTAEEVKRLKRREGVRKYRAQGTASLRAILKDIEQTYGLPVKSLRVINPEIGKPYRRDARIGTIRWNAGE